MNRFIIFVTIIVPLLIIVLYGEIKLVAAGEKYSSDKEETYLPEPKLRGKMSVEEAIFKRRSIRDYSDKPLKLEDLSQILWAAQGITEPNKKFRAAPSAGATYPLEIYVVVKEVEGLAPGVYRYIPFKHSLKLIKKGDYSYQLYRACLSQKWVLDAKANLVITAVYERTTWIYGKRGVRYVHMEAGHVGQNIYLQATALGIGTVAVGAFYDEKVEKIVGSSPNERALYVFPLGYKK